MAPWITGLVKHPYELLAEGGPFGHNGRSHDFVYWQGWKRPNRAWSAYWLTDALQLANPHQ